VAALGRPGDAPQRTQGHSTGYRDWDSHYWKVGTGHDSRAAWSGAFVSYVMKEAGAGAWPATRSHAHYIRVATQNP
jgi:hypothetical protein